MKKTGKVYLVGAGPGRPDLLTLRGAECLKLADVVLSDSLVSPRLFEHCRPGTRIIKPRHGKFRHSVWRQPGINRLMLRYARSGKTIVRLKCGDPYFFSRGAEEAEYLSQHNIPFEVVPGVSSVSAVPAYAGIPLTHNTNNSTLTVITGDDGRENTFTAGTTNRAPGVNWERLSPEGTLVVLMGVNQLEDIVRRLIFNGWSPRLPVAVVQRGTSPFQKTVEGTLENIAARVRSAGLTPPAVIVAGQVVAYRRKLNWFERLPLFGKTILVTRASDQAEEMTRLLEASGARAIISPLIQIRPFPLGVAGRRRLDRLAGYDGVIFTSANAARIFAKHWGTPRRIWPLRTPVYAVGPKTAGILAQNGIPVMRTAKEYRAEAVTGLLGRVAGKQYLFPRALEGREVIPDYLRRRGARLDLWSLYRTVPQKMTPLARKALLNGDVDCATFTSASTVRFFMEGFSPHQRKKIFSKTKAASVGSVTTRKLEEYGVRSVLQPRRATVDGLVVAVAAYFNKQR